MLSALAAISVVLSLVAVTLLVVLLLRGRHDATARKLEQLAQAQERGERLLRDEMDRVRDEAGRHAQRSREDGHRSCQELG